MILYFAYLFILLEALAGLQTFNKRVGMNRRPDYDFCLFSSVVTDVNSYSDFFDRVGNKPKNCWPVANIPGKYEYLFIFFVVVYIE